MTLDEHTRHLPTIGLDEVVHHASLLTRVDRKYIVRPEDLGSAIDELVETPRVLEIEGRRSFRYRSTYFDTDDLCSYRDAAHRRPQRWKVRTRTYVDTDTCWIEVKRRERSGRTTKRRAPHPMHSAWELAAVTDFFLVEPDIADLADHLRPTLTTAYRRSTLVVGQRVTIDEGLRCIAADGSGSVGLGDVLIVETKCDGRRPGAVDRALWRVGIRPTKISKYGVGMAALHPDLPHNRWHRVLQRHVSATRPILDDAPQRIVAPTTPGELR